MHDYSANWAQQLQKVAPNQSKPVPHTKTPTIIYKRKQLKALGNNPSQPTTLVCC